MRAYDRAILYLLGGAGVALPPLAWIGRLGARFARVALRAQASQPRVPASFQRLAPQPPLAKVTRRPPRVMLCIGSLNPGGAERQFCNLAVGLNRRGYRLHLVTTAALDGTLGHYAELLRKEGLESVVAGAAHRRWHWKHSQSRVVTDVPAYLAPTVLNLAREMWADPPDIVHAWLDHTNVWAGVAALLAGVPLIVLSTRNVNPSHLPYLHQPWFQPWYRLLESSPRVFFINNSRAGARDYADWLGVPAARFRVILNGLDPATIQRPEREAVAEFRRSLGLSEGQPLIGGVFRLSDEKQPWVFADVATRVLALKPEAHAAIIGTGPRDNDVRRAVAGLKERFHLLGTMDRPNVFLSACAVMLHTSAHEGTPNAVLEAQHLGCPPVATAAAGTVDAVRDGETGLLLPVGDVDGLTRAVLRLLDEPHTRARLAEAGPRFIQERFGLDRMVEETIAVYHEALARFG